MSDASPRERPIDLHHRRPWQCGPGKTYWSKTLKNQLWAQYVEKTVGQAKGPLILGVPSDSGAGICRGSNHGPQFLREVLYKLDAKNLLGELGDIPCIPQLSHDSLLTSEQKRRSGVALWGESYREFFPVSPLNILESVLVHIWRRDANLPVFVMGGDHSISEAIFRAMRTSQKISQLGVLHFDAHTDLLEDRYGIAHCFGTWAAHSVKMLPKPKAFVQLGLRTSGFDQGYWEEKYGLRQIWAKEARRKSAKALARELVTDWKLLGIKDLYVSFDIDALDPKFAPSTGTPEKQGLDLKWTSDLLNEVLKSMNLVAADLVEVAPVLGSKAEISKTVRSSAKIATALLQGLRKK